MKGFSIPNEPSGLFRFPKVKLQAAWQVLPSSQPQLAISLCDKLDTAEISVHPQIILSEQNDRRRETRANSNN
jgi:hypothetical protein